MALEDSFKIGNKRRIKSRCVPYVPHIKPTRSRFIDIEGLVSGRLTVDGYLGINDGDGYWLCMCECGKRKAVRGSQLRDSASRPTNSCGCLVKELATTRGHAAHPEYNRYIGIIRRCVTKHTVSEDTWARYGGRGIKVHQEWIDNPGAFYEYIGKPPAPNMDIDRIDNDGNYEPGNIRWATRQVNVQNSRLAKLNPIAVLEIRKLSNGGLRAKEIRKRMRLDVTLQTIRYAAKGRTWSNI